MEYQHLNLSLVRAIPPLLCPLKLDSIISTGISEKLCIGPLAGIPTTVLTGQVAVKLTVERRTGIL